MGPIWGRQDPDGPHVGLMNFAIWVIPVGACWEHVPHPAINVGVVKCTRFHSIGPLWWESTRHRGTPLPKGDESGAFTFFVVILLNRQWSGWWNETPYLSCDVNLMLSFALNRSMRWWLLLEPQFSVCGPVSSRPVYSVHWWYGRRQTLCLLPTCLSHMPWWHHVRRTHQGLQLSYWLQQRRQTLQVCRPRLLKLSYSVQSTTTRFFHSALLKSQRLMHISPSCTFNPDVYTL